MTAEGIREQVPGWVAQMREVASAQPATGACAVATAFDLWAWTFDRVAGAGQERAEEAPARARALTEGLGWLLSSRALVLEAARSGDAHSADLCQAHAARACGEVGRICAEVVYGWLRHPSWEADSQACYHAEDLDALEEYVPGLSSCARAYSDVIESDGSHPAKRGPCVRFEAVEEFVRLRARLDACLAGAGAARGRAEERTLDLLRNLR